MGKIRRTPRFDCHDDLFLDIDTGLESNFLTRKISAVTYYLLSVWRNILSVISFQV